MHRPQPGKAKRAKEGEEGEKERRREGDKRVQEKWNEISEERQSQGKRGTTTGEA